MNTVEAISLSKEYELRTTRFSTFKEFVLRDFFHREETRRLLALRDVSFSLPQGKTLGIIGGNGSGKTTLLRLIAGITEPTSGELKVSGKVAAILELGVGFHPELNAIENIYLNGAMLGISRQQLKKSLDEIIDFAELRPFIYMPLKHFSSGMRLRLGFSIALNVDPDILLIDEVLAVGDQGFQKKSLEKIKEFKRRGKTIIFVTHNLDQAEILCDEVLWLDNGKIRQCGETEEVVNNYVLHAHRLHRQLPLQPFHYEHCVISDMGRYGNGDVTIDEVLIKKTDGTPVRHIPANTPLTIELHYCCHKPIAEMDCHIGLGRFDGANVCLCAAKNYAQLIRPQGKRGIIRLIFDPLVFQPGKYLLSVELLPPDEPFNPYDLQLRMYTFSIKGENRESEDALHPAVLLPAEISAESFNYRGCALI